MATRTADAHRDVHGESMQRLFHENTRPPRSVPQQFREKLASTPPPTPHPVQNSPRTPPSAASPVQNSRRTPPPGTKLSQHSRKHPIWALFRVQGEYIHACGSNRPSRANVFTHADQTSQAEDLRLRTQPPLRLSTRPPTSVPQHGRTPHRQGRSTYSRRPLHPRSGNSC